MQWANILKEAFHQTLRVTNFFCLLHVTDTYLCSLIAPYGPSMLPTFDLTGNIVLGERISTRSGKVRVGDVVLVRSPANPTLQITKRVKGVEGDTVTYVVDPQKSHRVDTIVVPKGHIWIEGDNIYNSKDSRDFGPVPYGLVQAREFWKIIPLKDFGPVDSSGGNDATS